MAGGVWVCGGSAGGGGEEHEERGKGIVESGGRAPARAGAGRLGSAAGQVRGGVGQALMIRG